MVVAATAGMSITAVHLYSLGALLGPIQQDTGWSRTQITLGQTTASGLSALLAPLCGVLMDRYGPRRIAVPGVVVFCLGLIGFSTIGQSLAHWYAMWVVLAIGLIGLKPNVWTGAVAGAFATSRGLAFAVVISGVSLSSSFAPIIVTELAARFGWRGAYVGLGVIWAVVLLPLCLLLPRQPRRSPMSDVKAMIVPGISVRAALRSFIFAKLAVTGLLFTTALFATAFHFVPMLRDRGIDATSAASVAGTIGLTAVGGRLVTGLLLDRLPGALVGGIALLLPIIPAVTLLAIDGGSIPLAIMVAVFIGLSIGSEMDILAYLATRHFGLRHYGTLFGCLIGVLAGATALGPVLGSAIRDYSGSYAMLLWLTIPAFALSALTIATTGPYPDVTADRG